MLYGTTSYFTAVRSRWTVNDPRTWRTVCLKCNWVEVSFNHKLPATNFNDFLYLFLFDYFFWSNKGPTVIGIKAVVVSQLGVQEINYYWVIVAQINYFSVWRQSNETIKFFGVFSSGYAKTCILDGLKENTQHRYRVQIILPNLSTPWSSATEVTTLSRLITTTA